MIFDKTKTIEHEADKHVFPAVMINGYRYNIDRKNRQFVRETYEEKTIPYDVLTLAQADEISQSLGNWEWYKTAIK